MRKETEPITPSAASDLYDRLKNCRLVPDAACKGLTLEGFFDPLPDVFLVSKSLRREVYYIQTRFGNFYLKYSPLRKKKDRRRFLLLPWRIRTEWRNLERLRQRSVPAPQRVLFGYKGRLPCRGFFIITRDVEGSKINWRQPEQLLKLADFLARVHSRGVYHQDLHTGNIYIGRDGRPILLDSQEVYLLPWLPRWLKVRNLGQFWRQIRAGFADEGVLEAFLKAYNAGQKPPVSAREVLKTADRSLERYYRSRSGRCVKNSTEFQVVKSDDGIRGFRRRGFEWGKDELQAALTHGTPVKDNKMLAWQGVCVKLHERRFLHTDRCLAAWKMARALAVRGIAVPEARAYYVLGRKSFFLADYYGDGEHLNVYLSKPREPAEKRGVLRRLAEWVRICHDLNIWQRDFKSSNVLVHEGQYMMLDLDNVRIGRGLSWKRRMSNLAQLNASVSSAITLKDRLRFFHYYCRGRIPSLTNRRKIYQHIWQITQKKNTQDFGLDPGKLLVELRKISGGRL